MPPTTPKPGAKPRARVWRWLIALAVVVALTVGGWFGWRSYSESSAPPQYRTAKVMRGPLTATVSATGTLNPVTSVQVGSQVSGQLKEVLVDFNAEVKQGQLIARIDPETFEYKVRQAQADLDAIKAQALTAQANVMAAQAAVSRADVNAAEAKRDYDRKQMLVERNFISTADRDKSLSTSNASAEDAKVSRAQLQVAQAQANSADATVKQREAMLVQAQIDLERTSIRAPVDGTVIKRSVDAGQTVAASLQSPELFIIAKNLHDMQVDTSIDEAEIGKLKVGQRATFTVDSFPGRSFSGEVLQVRKAALNVQNVITYVVVISALNPDLSLVPGMTANVRIVNDTRDSVLKVPNAALRFRPAGWQEPAPSAQALPPALAALAGRIASLLPSAVAQPAGSPLVRLRERLLADLALSEAQTVKLDAILAGMREKFGAVRELPEDQRGPAMEHARTEMREKITQILTPDQKTKYAAIVAEAAARQAGSGGGTGATPGTAAPRAAPNAAAKSTAPSAASPGGAGGPGGQLRQFRERLERELSLSADQLQQVDAIFAGMREKFAAVRDAPESERAKLSERNRTEMRERIADILSPEQKKRYAQMVAELAGRQSTRGRVFVMGDDGKPRAVQVRTGLTDGTFTEVSGELEEGALVLIGTAGTSRDAPKSGAPAGPRLPF